MRKRTVNTHPALPQQPHPQVPKPATCHSPPPLVFTHPLAVISPNWHVERPMRRPIAFRSTYLQVLAAPVCSNVCTPLPPGYAWLLRPCPLVWHAILKGDRALPSGVGPADSGGAQGRGRKVGRCPPKTAHFVPQNSLFWPKPAPKPSHNGQTKANGGHTPRAPRLPREQEPFLAL